MKINGVYYLEMLMLQKLSPLIKQISGNWVVFQQDNAPAYFMYETIKTIYSEMPDFLATKQSR